MTYIKECMILTGRDSLQNITGEVTETIRESKVQNGTVTVESADSTAGILMIDSYGKEILDDITKEMRRIVPARINYLHQESPENAAGHIKSALFGTSVSLIVKEGRLMCEGKKDVYFADYDGPQERSYVICVVGE